MQSNEKHKVTPKTRNKSGTVKGLKIKVWRSISRLSQMVENAETESLRIKSAAALASLAGVWLRSHEQSDLEARLRALEAERSEEQ